MNKDTDFKRARSAPPTKDEAKQLNEDGVTSKNPPGETVDTADTRNKGGSADTKREAESADSFMVSVRMKKTLTLDAGTNEKSQKGESKRMSLAEARNYVKRDLAEWTDPRPDL